MAKTNDEKSVFSTLYGVNVNDYTEKKNTGVGKELTYLTWSFAFAEVKKRYPDASYTIYHDEHHRPYIEDADFGIMCFTTVTIEGQTHEMWLPVMNGANKAMRRTPYKYQVWNSYKRAFEEKTVEAATMFDINKTIMRCLVKNLAMFGLGLYIYAGEDLPEDQSDETQEPADKTTAKTATKAPAAKPAAKPAPQPQQQPQQQTMFGGASEEELLEEAFMLIKQNIENAPSRAYLDDIHEKNKPLHNYPPYRAAMNKRFKEVA